MRRKRKIFVKYLILLLVLFIPFALIAQNKVEIKSVKTDDQTMQWMTKISSDSELRITMMEMMLYQTKDNEVEMRKLVNAFMDNPNMQKIMMTTHTEISETQINSVEPIE
jgi:hypothetical protein